MAAPIVWATPAVGPSALPAITSITDFSTTYAWPELLRWVLFAGGVALVPLVIKRLMGK